VSSERKVRIGIVIRGRQPRGGGPGAPSSTYHLTARDRGPLPAVKVHGFGACTSDKRGVSTP
jgi:hypothetical protein